MIYFVIPTYNGIICGKPFILNNLDIFRHINEFEAAIFSINLFTLEVLEVDIDDL